MSDNDMIFAIDPKPNHADIQVECPPTGGTPVTVGGSPSREAAVPGTPRVVASRCGQARVETARTRESSIESALIV
jgi:hypothetical protein